MEEQCNAKLRAVAAYLHYRELPPDDARRIRRHFRPVAAYVPPPQKAAALKAASAATSGPFINSSAQSRIRRHFRPLH